MEKLNLKSLEKISGKGAWALQYIDSSKPIAITSKKTLKNNFTLAFNPCDKSQVMAILEGNPVIEWEENLNLNESIPFYSRDLLHQWFPNYPTRSMYNPTGFKNINPVPPIPEEFNV